MTGELPKNIMTCGFFLQLLGAERVRPRQTATLNCDLLRSKKTPVRYPTQYTEHALPMRTEEPLHGKMFPFPYEWKEIEER